MSQVKIPHGEETIQVELTVKEAIALTGIRFNAEPKIKSEARKKLHATIAEKTGAIQAH
jgi:hypothetical protein